MAQSPLRAAGSFALGFSSLADTLSRPPPPVWNHNHGFTFSFPLPPPCSPPCQDNWRPQRPLAAQGPEKMRFSLKKNKKKKRRMRVDSSKISLCPRLHRQSAGHGERPGQGEGKQMVWCGRTRGFLANTLVQSLFWKRAHLHNCTFCPQLDGRWVHASVFTHQSAENTTPNVWFYCCSWTHNITYLCTQHENFDKLKAAHE